MELPLHTRFFEEGLSLGGHLVESAPRVDTQLTEALFSGVTSANPEWISTRCFDGAMRIAVSVAYLFDAQEQGFLDTVDATLVAGNYTMQVIDKN